MNKSILNLLTIIIVVSLFSIIYFSIEKFNQSKITRSITDKACSTPQKICAYIKYKYTNVLEAEIILVPGEYYYIDKKKNNYNKYWVNWQKLKSNKNNDIYNDKSFVIENFVSTINKSNDSITIIFEDKNGFLIEKIKISSSLKDPKTNGMTKNINRVNKGGIKIAKKIFFKKKITIKNYKRINNISLKWNPLFIDNLPD